MLLCEAKVPSSDKYIAQYKNVTMPLSTKYIHHLSAVSNEVYNFALAEGVEKLLGIKF